MEEKLEVEVKESFVKKHTKGIKRGLAVVGGIVGLAVAGAIINKKVNQSEDFVGYGEDPESTDENPVD